jgi:hypothetical protein
MNEVTLALLYPYIPFLIVLLAFAIFDKEEDDDDDQGGGKPQLVYNPI